MTPPLLRAVVLRTRPFSETSLWVRLFSESHGKIAGLSKGARRGKERIYTPLIEVEVKGYPPRADEHGLWTIGKPDLLRDWRSLTGDTDVLAYAWSILELIDTIVEEAHPQPELYADLESSLDALECGQADTAPAQLIWFMIRFADHLGYSLQYEICPRCGKPLVYPVGAMVSSLGGILCRKCSPAGTSSIPQLLWEMFVQIAAEDQPPQIVLPLKLRDRLISMVTDYLSYHTERPVKLKSLGLLSDYGNHRG